MCFQQPHYEFLGPQGPGAACCGQVPPSWAAGYESPKSHERKQVTGLSSASPSSGREFSGQVPSGSVKMFFQADGEISLRWFRGCYEVGEPLTHPHLFL